jgi:ferredoxin
MARTPYVDQDACIGCQLCANTLPEVFRMNEHSLAEVHAPAGAPEDQIQEVIDSCPVNCIHWEG